MAVFNNTTCETCPSGPCGSSIKGNSAGSKRNSEAGVEETCRETQEMAERLRELKQLLDRHAFSPDLRFPPSMISQMAAYSVASFQTDDAKTKRRWSFGVEEADELSNAITKARSLLHNLAKGLRLRVIVVALLALTAVVRLGADATLVANGELDGSAAVASLILSILMGGLGATALVALFMTSQSVPSVLATLEVGSPISQRAESAMSITSARPPNPRMVRNGPSQRRDNGSSGNMLVEL